MKAIFTLLLFTSLNLSAYNSFAESIVVAGDAPPASQVVPNVYAGTSGTGTFLGPLSNAQRTYQFLIQSTQLTDLVGKSLTGLSMRIPVSATANWPLADVTFTNYNIYLSGSVEPSARSLTFANNIVGPQTLVRSGSLTVLANAYTFGSDPNSFGTEIVFNTPWLYTGGNLLVEIRHSGFSGTSRSTDALTTSTSGYGTLFSACWTGSYTGTAGTQGNFTVLKLNGSGSSLNLRLSALIEGLYDGTTNVMIGDTAKIYLRSANSPYNLVDSSVSVLDSNGNGNFTFLNASNGVNYYLVVDQRNSINTWSSGVHSFTNDSLIYNFTTAAAQAYGSNQKLIGARWTVYSGDVNKDGFVDLTDLVIIDNGASIFLTGYVVTDVNGDLFTNLQDILLAYNNAAEFIAEVRP